MKKERPPVPQVPDIDFAVNVKARELRFDELPKAAEVRFRGDPEGDSFSGTERENLPEEVQRGVVYRNVSVKFRAACELVDGEQDPWQKRKEARQ